MKFYLDITLLPDAEANLGFIWQKVYQQLHLALVEEQTGNNRSDIAVCMPEYNHKGFPLGSKLRLFSHTQEQLEKLEINKWLNRLVDYTHSTSIKNVPSLVAQYACFKRVQFDTNILRLARRREKRKDETLEQALAYYSGFKDSESELPYVNMHSLSNDKNFRLFIKQEILDRAEVGEFSCYGLSKTATVPWF